MSAYVAVGPKSSTPSKKESPHLDFALNPSTDITLQASDGVQFHSSKTLLSANSTVFSDMYTSSGPSIAVLGRSASPEENIVQMSEDSKSLALLLCWMHPKLARALRISTGDQLQKAVKLLILAEKYDVSIITMRIEDQLITLAVQTDAQSGDEAPLLAFRIYCIAYRFQLTECARQAALRTLPMPFHGFIATPLEETQLLAISDLAALAKYHHTCCQTACDKLDVHIFCNSSTSADGFLCTSHSKRERYFENGISEKSARWKMPFHPECNNCADIGFVPWVYLLFSECKALCAARVDLRDIVELVFYDERFGQSVVEAEGDCWYCNKYCASSTTLPRLASLQRVIMEQVMLVIHEVQMQSQVS